MTVATHSFGGQGRPFVGVWTAAVEFRLLARHDPLYGWGMVKESLQARRWLAAG
ncbi:MAG: hypothetical protein AB7N65_23470 [Vicinamibacterales bacterium]